MHRPACGPLQSGRDRRSRRRTRRGASFADIAEDSSRFANYLVAQGVQAGDRVAVMLEPSRAFYMAVFGTMKLGAIAVPLFTLFGPDGVKLRVEDCTPRLLVTNAEKAGLPLGAGPRVVVADDAFMTELEQFAPQFAADTPADALAIFQYTSGTTRELPEAVKHTHRSIVTLMVAALYGTGLRPGDRFICPSSPAWGHGLWHGTLAPLALGITVGAYAGKFNAERLLAALQQHEFTNISAAATHYRMMRSSGAAPRYRYAIEKLSFTGEPIDSETAAFAEADVRPAGLQHVRHDRDRRDPGELSGAPRISPSSAARSASRFPAGGSRSTAPAGSRAPPA